MSRRAAIALLALCACPVLASSVQVNEGAIVFVAGDGVPRSLVPTRDNRDAVLSPDGRQVVYIHDPAPAIPGADAPDASELWLVDAEGRSPRRLVENRPSETPEENLTAFNSPVFGLDGRSIYFLTEAWVTSNALHRVDLETGRVRYITDANSVQVVTEGRHRGKLVVEKHKYFEGGGSYDHFWLVTPEGKEVRKAGTTTNGVRRFLHR